MDSLRQFVHLNAIELIERWDPWVEDCLAVIQRSIPWWRMVTSAAALRRMVRVTCAAEHRVLLDDLVADYCDFRNSLRVYVSVGR